MRALTRSDLARFTLPEGAFRVPAGLYRVTDGDTIRLLSGQRSPLGQELTVLRIRFRTIAAPETRKARWADAPLIAIDADPGRFCPGRRAKEMLIRFTRKRDLIVSHHGRFDRYGRLLADLSVLPEPGAPLAQAVSLERVMLARGVVDRLSTDPVPPLHPYGDNLTPHP